MLLVMLFVKYFWFIAALFGLINTAIFKNSIEKEIDNTKNNMEEIKRIINIYFLLYTSPFIVLQVLQLIGGYKTAFYVFLLEFSSISYCVAFCILPLCWIFIFYIFIIQNGAQAVMKYNSSFRVFPKNIKYIKLLIVLSIMAGIFTLFIYTRVPELWMIVKSLESR